ncbi:neprilysin-3-like [Centruroides vittatus]|uniref:neprilysin-3-like n=1 Tax=Centruroides vittatus TaxID=120091 RepID=UPI00350F506A
MNTFVRDELRNLRVKGTQIYTEGMSFRIFMYCILVLIIIIFVFGSFMIYQKTKSSSLPCISASCVDAAIDILLWIDESVDPCEDFYSFVCGQKQKNSWKQGIIFNKIIEKQRKIDNVLINIFNKKIMNLTAPISRKALNYYQFCLYPYKRNEKNMVFYMIKEFGGWPIMRNWKETGFLFSTVASVTKISKHGLFEVGVTLNSKNKAENILMIKRVPSDDVTNQTIIGLTSYPSAYLTAFEIEELEQLHEARNFEDETDPNDSLEIMTIKEFGKRTTFDKWIDFFNMVLEDANKTVTESDAIAVYNVNYFKNLILTINRKHISERTLANYVVFQAITYFGNYMTKYRINNVSQPDKCITVLKDLMPFYVDHLFIKKHTDLTYMIKYMMEFITHEFEIFLNQSSWIDSSKRKSLIKKLENMQFLYGYDTKIKDIDYVNDYYKYVPDPTDDWMQTTLYLSYIPNLNKYAQITIPVNGISWPHYSITNARIYNVESSNVIVIPETVIQKPFFDIDAPSYLNFALIGTLISRELIRSLIGKEGKRNEFRFVADWFGEEDRKQFEKRIQSFKQQYNALNVSMDDAEINVDELSNIGEILHRVTADDMAIGLAYRAYQRWVNINGEDQSLPRLENFTIPQLFFLSYTNLWCTGGHNSSDKYRINISNRNVKEFNEAFNCRKKSASNFSKDAISFCVVC